MDIIDSATYDAKVEDIENLGLPEDVKKLLAKFFDELKEITIELSKVVKDKQTMDQMQKDAKTKYESRGLDKEIVSVTKAISIIRKKKVDWHSHLAMQVSQLCDRRNEEIERKAQADQRRTAKEKRQKTRA